MNQRILEMLIRAKSAVGPGVAQAKQGMDSLRGAAKSAATGINQAMAGATKVVKSFGTAAVSVAQAIRRNWLLLTAALAAMLLALKKLTSAASEQEFATRKLEIALTKTGGATREQIKNLTKYAEALQATTGFQDEQIINAQALLATYRLNAEQIRQTTPVLLDMAAAMSTASGETVDLSTAAMVMGKALNGNAGILARYGIQIDESIIKSRDFSKIMGELQRKFGGFAETLGGATFTGAMKIMGASFSDLLESLGAVFTESDYVRGMILTLGQAFQKATEWINDNRQALTKYVEGALSGFIESTRLAINTQIQFGNALRIVAKSGPLSGFIESTRLAINTQIQFGNALRIVAKSGPVALGALATSGKLMEELNKGTLGVNKAFDKFDQNAQKAAKASTNYQQALQALQGTSKATGMSLEELTAKFPALVEAGKQFATTMKDTISDVLFEGVVSKGETFKEKMVGIFNDLKSRLLRIFTDMLAEMIMAKIKSGFMQALAGGGSGGGGGLGGLLQGAAGMLTNSAGGGVTGGGGAGGAAMSAAMGYFMPGGNAGMQAANGLKSLASSSTQAATATQAATKGMASAAQGAQAAAGGMSAMGTIGLAFAAGLAGTQLAGAITGGKGIAGQKGKFGTLGAIAGGVLGFAVGGPLGAAVGAGAGGFLGGLFHYGGKIPHRADYGTKARPNDRMIMAQTGEGVISRQGMEQIGDSGLAQLNRGEPLAGGGGDIWHVSIYAVDSKSFVEQLNRNPDAVLRIVQRGIKKNAQIRGDIREHTK